MWVTCWIADWTPTLCPRSCEASIKAQRMTVKVDRYPFTKPLFVKMRLLNAQVSTALLTPTLQPFSDSDTTHNYDDI